VQPGAHAKIFPAGAAGAHHAITSLKLLAPAEKPWASARGFRAVARRPAAGISPKS